MVRYWMVEIRKSYNLTQKRIARMIGISQPVYNRIERGTQNPSVKTAKRIAQMFGFEWTKFFEEDGKEVRKNASPEAAEVLQHEGHHGNAEREPDAGAGNDAHV